MVQLFLWQGTMINFVDTTIAMHSPCRELRIVVSVSYVFEHTTCRYFYIWLLKENVDCPYNAWMSPSVIALIVTADGIRPAVSQFVWYTSARLRNESACISHFLHHSVMLLLSKEICLVRLSQSQMQFFSNPEILIALAEICITFPKF